MHCCSICIRNSCTDISHNEASLSKIKQRSRCILAVALFVRMCKQWNYPFPARIYPDDIQPLAGLLADKHSRVLRIYVRIHLYKINRFEKNLVPSIQQPFNTEEKKTDTLRVSPFFNQKNLNSYIFIRLKFTM